MTTVQIAIRNSELAEALAKLAKADGLDVLQLNSPDSRIPGPIVLDDVLLPQIQPDEANRVIVVVTQTDSTFLSGLWEQGVRNVIFPGSRPEIVHLAIKAAVLRIAAGEPRDCSILDGEGAPLLGNGLEGPFALTDDAIDEVVRERSPGAFVLESTNEGMRSVFVGRSDFDVNNQLHVYVGAYTRFKFVYAPSPRAAFERQCVLFHDFDPTDGTGHPFRPPGTDWTCPRCKLLG